MSQTNNKYPVLKIRNKQPGITTGANVDVTLDGQPLKNLSFLKLEIKAHKVAKVMMEMYVEIDAELEPGNTELQVKKISGWQAILGSLCPNFFKNK